MLLVHLVYIYLEAGFDPVTHFCFDFYHHFEQNGSFGFLTICVSRGQYPLVLVDGFEFFAASFHVASTFGIHMCDCAHTNSTS